MVTVPSNANASADPRDSKPLSALTVASTPWVFTQRHPLKLDGFAGEAKRRGFKLDASILRELYRHRLLVPFISIQDRRVSEPVPRIEEPFPGSSLLVDLRWAREKGKLQDLALIPFRPHMPFTRRSTFSRRWWNGLMYSWYQLHALLPLSTTLDNRRYRGRSRDRKVALPAPTASLTEQASLFRRIALTATALEARYLPKLDPEWVHLTNVNFDEWDQYRKSFDPIATSKALNYTGEQAVQDAEHLLALARSIDPLGGTWGRLARRAPSKARSQLKDAALSAMDLRETAEILFLFHDDLTQRESTQTAEGKPIEVSHFSEERLSYRKNTLDEDLVSLGLSPHPRVVLAVEGESEEVHVPLIWKNLGYSDAPELMRTLRLGGVDKDLQKVAALAATPLVSKKIDDRHWDLLKPPTCLMIAVDPEGKFAPRRIDNTRKGILDEIKSVLSAQEARTTDKELGELLHIQTWSASCYEFAHFENEELADALMAVHKTVNGMTRDELIIALQKLRDRSKNGHERVDIKQVWGQWAYEPSKVELARELWSTLERKIQRCRDEDDAPVPEIVEVVERAHAIAQRWRYSSFTITAI
jgi:hypothetical protein